LDIIVDDNRGVFQSVRLASSAIKQERFFETHDELFKILAGLGIDVMDKKPDYNQKWFPIATTPAYDTETFGQRDFVDTDLGIHRTEPCHIAFLHSEYSGDMWLVEGCGDPKRHSKTGGSNTKLDGVAKASKAADPQKEQQAKDRKEKQARKEEGIAWIGEQKMTVADTAPYVDIAWRELLSNDMAQQFNKTMGLEKVYSNGAYSGTGTMEKYIEEKYDSPHTRMSYVAYLLHAYQYVLPYHSRKELGL